MKYTEQEHKYALRKSNKIRGINLLGGKCIVCGEENIHVLEFHHDEKNKENSISQIVDYRWSILEKEIKKCQLLCSNCHAEYHCNGEGGASKRKIQILKTLKIFKCSKCGYEGKNFSSLDFHHQDPKTKSFKISKRIDRITLEEILSESEKCIIVCKSCHKKEHFDIETFNRLWPLIEYKIQNPKEKPSEYDKDAIWKLYQEKKCLSDICKIIGCKHGTIAYIIKQLRERHGMEFKDHRSGRKCIKT